MKNLIINITLSLIIIPCLSQNIGYMGKKHTIEGSIGTFFREASPYIDFVNNFKASKTFSRNFSMSVELSFSSASNKAMDFFDDDNNKNSAFYRGFGIYFNFFSNKSIAPIGSSFSLFFKYNYAKMNEFENQISSITIRKDKLETVFYSLGMAYNKQFFLSKRNNLFIAFNAKAGVPFPLTGKVKLNNNPTRTSLIANGDDKRFVTYHQLQDVFQLSFGLGYIL